MKLLLFSDVHVNKTHCRRVVEMSKEVDLVIGAGDFGSLRMGIKKTIKWLSAIDRPSILVPGNAESFKELQKACENWTSAIVLHGTKTQISGQTFFGIGGGIPVTPFGPWSYDFTEEEGRDLLKKCPEKAVLISHSPPYGGLDVSSRGQHLGSYAVLETIQSRNPKLVVCGHIHESSGREIEFEGTTLVNAGPRGVFYNLSG